MLRTLPPYPQRTDGLGSLSSTPGVLRASEPCQISTPPRLTTMSPSSRPRRGSSPVVAGSLLLATIILCAAVGAGIGSLFDAIAPLTIVGLFLGFGAGLAVVISRFRDV